jgi:hypothetical protein
MTTMYTYRAEATIDSDTFLTQVREAGYPVTDLRKQHPLFDVLVEFTSTASIDTLLTLARNVIDGHIIVRTLRPGGIETSYLSDYVRFE